MSGFVYFIGPEALYHRDQDTRLVKIGFTRNNPEARLRALRCGSPLVLDIWAYMDGSEALEKAFHEAFAECRSHGEWFFLQHKLADFLGYFPGPPGNCYVTPAQVEVALFDNVYSNFVPHPSVNEKEWLASADVTPLLNFFPELLLA